MGKFHAPSDSLKTMNQRLDWLIHRKNHRKLQKIDLFYEILIIYASSLENVSTSLIHRETKLFLYYSFGKSRWKSANMDFWIYRWLFKVSRKIRKTKKISSEEISRKMSHEKYQTEQSLEILTTEYTEKVGVSTNVEENLVWETQMKEFSLNFGFRAFFSFLFSYELCIYM